MTWWPVGVGLLLLLTADIFLTVFHPNAHGGPVNRRQNRVVWRLFCTVANRFSRGWKARMLSGGGPLLGVATLLGWWTVFWVGFAMIYRDQHHLLLHTQVPQASAWMAALYYSGYVGSTLGLGDVVAWSDFLRMLTIGQAVGGFMLVSVGVTYILALYRAEGQAESCATDIAMFFGAGGELHERRGRSMEATDRWADGTQRLFSAIVTAHAQYPILHYFRPPDVRQSTVLQAGNVLAFLEAVEIREPGALQRYPSLDALGATLFFYLHHAWGVYADEDDAEVLAPGDGSEGLDWNTGPDWHTARERYEALLRHLCYEQNPWQAAGSRNAHRVERSLHESVDR